MKEFLELREVIREERNKTFIERDMHRYAHKLIKLRELCEAYTTFVKESNSPSSP